MARDRAAAAQAVETALADLATAYEVDRSELESETLDVTFTDAEGQETKLHHESLAELTPDASSAAKARAEEFKTEVESKTPPTK